MSKYLSRRVLISGLAILPIALATGPASANRKRSGMPQKDRDDADREAAKDRAESAREVAKKERKADKNAAKAERKAAKKARKKN